MRRKILSPTLAWFFLFLVLVAAPLMEGLRGADDVPSAAVVASLSAVEDVPSSRRMLFHNHEKVVTSLTFAPDGRTVASASADRTLKVWEVSTGKLRAIRGCQGAINAARFSSDGRWLYTGTGGLDIQGGMICNEPVELSGWNIRTGKVFHLPGHRCEITDLALSPHGTLLASASTDSMIKLWNLRTCRETATLRGHDGAVWALAFSPNGQWLASGGADKCLRIWNVKNGQEWRSLKTEGTILTISIDSANQRAAWGDDRGRLGIYDFSRRKVSIWNGHRAAVYSVAFSPTDGVLAGASGDGTVILWSIATLKKRDTFKDHDDSLRSVAFSPDGRILASAGADKKLILRKVK